ncbi:hypothetical protein F4775DRAFT_554209 [Biscogniauxia sp. FL1348]|nr:hypothetical protein F4775DRAFT_554209 [Biscogniauxia sp. FL1348]
MFLYFRLGSGLSVKGGFLSYYLLVWLESVTPGPSSSSLGPDRVGGNAGWFRLPEPQLLGSGWPVASFFFLTPS